jgi:hypothetical protein
MKNLDKSKPEFMMYLQFILVLRLFFTLTTLLGSELINCVAVL